MAQVLEEAARKPPVRASLQWNDDFSVRLNSRSRRHSLDSVVVPNASSSALQGSGLISDILSANNTSTSNGSKPTAGPSTSRSTSWPNVSYAASPLQSSQSPYMVTQTAFNSSLGFLEQTNSDQDLFQKVPAQSMLGKRAVSLLKPQTPMFLPQHDPTQSASPVSLRPPASATQAIESRPTLSVWSETQRDLPSSYGGGYSRGYCPSAGVRADSFTSQPFLSGPMPSTPGIEMPLSSSLFGFMDIGPGHPLMRTAPRSTPFPQTSVLGGHGPNSRPPSPLPDPEPLHMA
ncbi:hypothetical protein BC831DRAFT_467711 [Entophlyctis helioformis]|nr:hypothetical protein BC831DRAFT_467711 [Entophlyctis helioformis]